MTQPQVERFDRGATHLQIGRTYRYREGLRPEAWQVVPTGGGALDGTVVKFAYLGSFQEVTVATALGEIFVVTPDTARAWRAGEAIGLALHERSVSVVAA